MPIPYNTKPVSQMAPGDHLCLSFDSEVERRTVLRAFVTDGIRTGHKVLYLAGTDPTAELGPYNTGLRDAQARDQLDIRPATDVYFRSGRFDPGLLTAGLRQEISRAQQAGHAGYRVAAEMGCFAADRTGSDRLVEHERAIQQLFGETGAMAICQYDRRTFEPAWLRRLEEAHCIGRVRANDLYDDGMLRMAPLFAPRGVAFHGELDVTIKGPAASALRTVSSEVSGDVYVDLSGLEFCDVGALRTFVRLSDDLVREGRQLVLAAAPRFLREMAQLCGWAGLPGLVFAS